MYYYIFDQPGGAHDYERTAKIKELLSSLGIAGEMGTPTPGRGVTDLVHNAITKRYATIVAVGGMALINQVARALEPYDAVLGIIPTIENPDITSLIGAQGWEAAAEQLKRRRWQPMRLGLLNGSSCFLTPACFSIQGDNSMDVHTPSFSLSERNAQVTISLLSGEQDATLQVNMTPLAQPKRGGLLSGLFQKETPAVLNSQFLLPNLQVFTKTPVDVSVAGSVIAQPPLTITVQSKPVRLIVGKTPTPA